MKNLGNCIKVKNNRIYIFKTIKGIVRRVSTKMLATDENLAYVRSNIECVLNNIFKEVGYVLQKDNHTLDESLVKTYDLFLNTLEIKDSSFEKYKSFKNELCEFFNTKKTSAMDADAIQLFVSYLTIKKQARSTIKFKVSTLIRSVNLYKHNFGFKELNFKDITLPKTLKSRVDAEPFKESEVCEILEKAKDSKVKYFSEFLQVLFFTGARLGEVLALKKESFNFENNHIYFSATKDKKGEITETKTKWSQRCVPFFDMGFKKNMEAFVSQSKNVFVFENLKGVDREWRRLLKELKIGYRKLYTTRHTFASLALVKNTNHNFIASVLGHKNLNTTFNYYGKYVKTAHENLDLNFLKGEASEPVKSKKGERYALFK